jgi:iron complex outermembrane recepter protein
MTDRQFRRAPLAFAIALSVQIAPLAVADTGIEQIIVTAQKREQSLQETPIAISALTSDALEQQDIRDVAALNGMVPNLRLASSPGNANGATINIRGAVTINPALTMEPTVGLYLDGIYIGKNVGGIRCCRSRTRRSIARPAGQFVR